MSLLATLLLTAQGIFDPIADLVAPALAGDRKATARLVARLLPVIRATVRKVIRKHEHRRIGPYDGDDLTQEIWLLLLRDDGKRLRAYDRNRAASLEGYVAMIARTEATHLVRREQTGGRGHGELQDSLDDAQHVRGGTDPEAEAISAELADRLRRRLSAELPARGQLVFALLYTDRLTPAEAAAVMKVNVQVVYNWQHKIRGIIREEVRGA